VNAWQAIVTLQATLRMMLRQKALSAGKERKMVPNKPRILFARIPLPRWRVFQEIA
jgi:hypothetical protein